MGKNTATAVDSAPFIPCCVSLNASSMNFASTTLQLRSVGFANRAKIPVAHPFERPFDLKATLAVLFWPTLLVHTQEKTAIAVILP